MPDSIEKRNGENEFIVRQITTGQEVRPRVGTDFVVLDNLNAPTLWHAVRAIDEDASVFMVSDNSSDLKGLRFAYPSSVKLIGKSSERWYHLLPGYISPKSESPNQKYEYQLIADRDLIESSDFDKIVLTIAVCEKGTERDSNPDIEYIDVPVPYFAYTHPNHAPLVLKTSPNRPEDIYFELETFYNQLPLGPRIEDGRVSKMVDTSGVILEKLHGNCPRDWRFHLNSNGYIISGDGLLALNSRFCTLTFPKSILMKDYHLIIRVRPARAGICLT